MALTLVSQSANDGSSITSMPSHQAGDLIVVFATRGNSTTLPTLASGYTALGTNTATTSSYRSGYKIATSSAETGGTWTGATQIMILVFRGQRKISVPIDHHGGQSGSSSPTVNYSGITTMNAPSSSMVLSFGCIVSLNTSIETARSNSTNIATFVGNTMELAAHLSTTAPASWVFNGQSVGGTAGAYMTATIEIEVDNGDIELRQSAIAATNGASTTGTYPIAPIAGNLLVAWAYTNGNISTLDISGWTKQTNAGLNYSGTAQSVQMFTKIADGSETTVTSTGNTICRLHIAEFANVDTTIFQTDGANNNATGTTTTVQTGSITTTNNDDLLLVIAGTSTGEAGTRSWNDSFNVMRDDSASPRLLSGYRIVTATGTFNPTATIGTTATNSGAAILAIKKAGTSKLPFFEDFESGIPGDFDSVGNQWGSPTATLDTSSKIEGANSVYFNATGEGHASAQVNILEDKSEIYIQFKGFIPSGQTWGAGNYSGLLQILDNSSAELARFNFDNYSVAGHVRLSAYTAATGYIDTGIDVPTGEVFILELRVKLNASTGVIAAWLNNNVEGSPDYTSGSVNTGSGIIRIARLGVFYVPEATLGYYVDNVKIQAGYAGFTSSDVTTTQTIQGKARIQLSTSQTILGRSRITVNTLRTILGRARITVATLRTIQGKARISISTSRTIQGISKIGSLTSRTITGKANILATTTRTILGRSAIVGTTARTIQGLSRITKTTTQTILGRANIANLSTKTITGKANIRNSVLRTILGKANILATSIRTITGRSRIVGVTEFKIANNLIVDANREDWIGAIYNALNGITMYPHDSESVGLGYFEPGDRVIIEDPEGNQYNTLILKTEVSIGNGFQESIEAKRPDLTSTNYDYAGKIGQVIKKTEIKVNKQAGEIALLNSDTAGNSTAIAILSDSVTQSVSEITGGLNNIQSGLDAQGEALTDVQEDVTTLQQTAQELTLSVQGIGGVNLIKNSVGLKGTLSEWQLLDSEGDLIDADNDATIDASSDTDIHTESGSAIVIAEQYIQQTVSTIVGERYTLYFRYKSYLDCDITISGVDGVLELTPSATWDTYKFQFIAVAASTTLRFDNTAYVGSTATLSDIVLKIGDAFGWSQAPNEVYGNNYVFDKEGLKIVSLTDPFKSQLDNRKFAVYDTSSGTDRVKLLVDKDKGIVTLLTVQDGFILQRYDNPSASLRMIPVEDGVYEIIND
jgi:hypothetical protein